MYFSLLPLEFEASIQGFSGLELCTLMTTYAIKGVIARKLGCLMVFDKAEDLRIENEDLKVEVQKLKDQVARMESNNNDLSAKVKTLTNHNQLQEEALINLQNVINKFATKLS